MQLYSNDIDDIQTLVDENENENLYKQRQLKVGQQYPLKYVISSSTLLIILNTLTVIFEIMHTDRFRIEDLDIISYRTLDLLVLAISIVNIILTILTIVTSKLFSKLEVKKTNFMYFLLIEKYSSVDIY